MTVRNPIVSVAKVCAIRYKARMAVIKPIGIPSRSMNHAQTGCPPVAEGVIAAQ